MSFGQGVSAGTIYANLKLNSSLDKDVKVANSKMDKLGSKMKSLAVPAAAAAAAIGLVGKASFNLAYDAGNAADRLLDLEQITGLSTVSLQEYTLVASRAGVGFEQFTAGISTFERKLPEIMEGTGRSAEMMDRLGVSIYDGAGNLRDMDDILPDVLAAMSSMDSETERNAMAMTLFGRNAEAILPVLALGADNMAAMQEEAHGLGLVMGEEDLKAANNFRMEVDQLKLQLGQVGRDIGVELIPAFRGFVDILQWATPGVVGFMRTVGKIGNAILWPFIRFYDVIGGAFKFLVGHVNDTIDLYNKVADELDKVGIHMEHLNHIDMSSPIEDLGRTASSTLDDVVDDYNAAQDAMSEPVMPGWAGHSDHIRSELDAAGIKTKAEGGSGNYNISGLMEHYGMETPATTVYNGTSGTGSSSSSGESATSMLSSISAGIDESNRLLKENISAIKNIKIPSGRSSGGFGSSGGTGAAEVTAFKKYQTIVDKVGGNITGGL